MASRNVLLDKYLTCHVGDFGLALDMRAEGGDAADDDDVLYGDVGLDTRRNTAASQEPVRKAAIRWAAIEVRQAQSGRVVP